MSKKQEKESKQNNCIKEVPYVAINFNKNMDSLLQFVNILNPMVKDAEKQGQLVDKLFIQKGKKVNNHRILTKSSLTPDEVRILEEHAENVKKLAPSLPLLKKGSFLILMSYLEFLIKDILKVYYYQHWGAMKDKEISISIADINVSSNIEELKQFAVEKHVDEIIYKNILEQIKLICQLLKIKQEDLCIDFDLINEADKRRNLLIHNDGKVNQKYIRESGKNNKIGEDLAVSTKYFNQVYDEIYLFGLVFLSYLSSNIKNHVSLCALQTYGIFELLRKEKYDLVNKYFNSCKKLDFIDGEVETVAKVNALLALKYGQQQEKYQQELSRVKYSHLGKRYQMAFAVLKGDKRKFLQLVSKSTLNADEWMTWPLFKEFREDEELSKKVYQKLKKKNAKK